MASIKIYKLNELFEVQHFLNGGIIGGELKSGVEGLVGLTLTFSHPSFACTFVTASRENDKLLLTDIKAQVEAASTASVIVLSFGGRIAFIETSPSSGVILSGTTEQAKALLGFDYNNATTGRVYDSPLSAVPTPPYLIQSYSVNETTHVLYTYE